MKIKQIIDWNEHRSISEAQDICEEIYEKLENYAFRSDIELEELANSDLEIIIAVIEKDI